MTWPVDVLSSLQSKRMLPSYPCCRSRLCTSHNLENLPHGLRLVVCGVSNVGCSASLPRAAGKGAKIRLLNNWKLFKHAPVYYVYHDSMRRGRVAPSHPQHHVADVHGISAVGYLPRRPPLAQTRKCLATTVKRLGWCGLDLPAHVMQDTGRVRRMNCASKFSLTAPP